MSQVYPLGKALMRRGCHDPASMASEVRRVLADARGADHYDAVVVECLDIDEATAIKALLTDGELAHVGFTWMLGGGSR